MPGDPLDAWHIIQELNQEHSDKLAKYEEVLYDWLDTDFDNISDVEEMKSRTRCLLRPE